MEKLIEILNNVIAHEGAKSPEPITAVTLKLNPALASRLQQETIDRCARQGIDLVQAHDASATFTVMANGITVTVIPLESGPEMYFSDKFNYAICDNLK